MKWKHTYLCGMQLKGTEREINSTKMLTILNYHLKKLEKEEQNKPKASKSKEIIKIKAEFNKTKIGKQQKIKF